ncbi:MAG: transglutaminase domain-containing protein [Chthonomonas sp.]|nr:transglutaminase domain-containing protein [Chthonomonas sp.]
MRQKSLDLGWLDYFLSAIATVSVLLSAGFSVRNSESGFIFASVALVGHLVSAVGPRIEKAWNRVSPDTIVFALAAAISIAFAGELNRILPNEGFPPQLLYTAGLCWAIAFASFFAWRDSTLLFLGVPAIALYGLVGAFDTFPAAPFMFFLFLVSTGMLFARSHLRGMLRMASAAGESDLQRLRRYEWKGLAGPEWALASAVGIVIFSAIGAPFIRASVQGATAPLRVPVRSNPANSPTALSSLGSGTPNPNRDNLRVGSGPFGRPSKNVILHAVMDKARYLRGEAYYRFSDNRWWSSDLDSTRLPRESGVSNLVTLNSEARLPGLTSFSYELTSMSRNLPGPYFPGIPAQVQLGGRGRASIREDGIVRASAESVGSSARGLSYEVDHDNVGKAVAPDYWQQSYGVVEISNEAKVLVNQTLRGAETDLEKADRLRSLVARTVTYNLQAAMVPDGTSVVENALFGTKEGYCDVFATTLAILARYAGLPSRVASGYLVSETSRRRGNLYQVRESDYHIWTEIYFENAGWVKFDATDGADEVDGFGRGDEWRPLPSWWQTSWGSTAANGLIGLCLIGLVSAFFWDLIRKRKPRLAGKHQMIADARTAAAASTLEALERYSRIPRRFEETTMEYATRLNQMIPEAGVDQVTFASAIDRLLFAPAGPKDGEAIKFLDQVKEAFRQVKKRS